MAGRADAGHREVLGVAGVLALVALQHLACWTREAVGGARLAGRAAGVAGLARVDPVEVISSNAARTGFGEVAAGAFIGTADIVNGYISGGTSSNTFVVLPYLGGVSTGETLIRIVDASGAVGGASHALVVGFCVRSSAASTCGHTAAASELQVVAGARRAAGTGGSRAGTSEARRSAGRATGAYVTRLAGGAASSGRAGLADRHALRAGAGGVGIPAVSTRTGADRSFEEIASRACSTRGTGASRASSRTSLAQRSDLVVAGGTWRRNTEACLEQQSSVARKAISGSALAGLAGSSTGHAHACCIEVVSVYASNARRGTVALDASGWTCLTHSQSINVVA